MEIIIELLAKFLWALCKDAIMLFIITKVKELLHEFFTVKKQQPNFV